MIAVVANYRLVPDVVYPGGADDVQMIREWIYSNISALEYGQGSVDKVVLLGHSAGGAHVAMNLYAAGTNISLFDTRSIWDAEQCLRRSSKIIERSTPPTGCCSRLPRRTFLV